jgi:hypothetical protein
MKDCIVIVKCRWTDSEYVLGPYHEAEANIIKGKRTNENNTAEVVKVR